MIVRRVVYVLLSLMLFAGCATVPNEITITAAAPEPVYISPRNADGVQDVFEAEVDLAMVKQTALAGYEVIVTDLNGTVVYALSEEAPPRPKGLRRLFSKPAGVEKPTVIIWDGRNQENDFVEDGEYRCVMRAWDMKEAEASYGPVSVIVDNTHPRLELSTSYRIFSPDGDGRLDTIVINQRSSTTEDSWVGTIRSGADVVRSFSWRGTAQDFVWDGKDSNGRRVPDGLYDYVVTSVDRAGNRGEYSLTNIEVDTQPKGIRLGVSVAAFSPDGDGKLDTVSFNPTVSTDKNLESWKVTVVDETGSEVRDFSGSGPVPRLIEFDGLNKAGRLLPDGLYRGVFTVRYIGGEEPETASPVIVLDTTAPVAAVNVDYPLFSPDGDGKRDSLLIRQSTSIESDWTGSIVDESGVVVRSFAWPGRAIAMSWDGKDDAGRIVPDGKYTYQLTSTDEAGNSVTEVLRGITVDTRPARVQVSTARRSFSPNNDGFFDTIAFNMSATPPDGIKSWSLAILDREGQNIKSYERAEETLPASIIWNGYTATGTAVDGSYTALLRAEYWKGDVAESRSSPFTLDTTGPVLTLDVSPKPFSPDGDGSADIVHIKLGAQDVSGIQDWLVRIHDPQGNPFKRFSGPGSSMDVIRWNGRSDSGEVVQSASEYTVVYSAWDTVGNVSSTEDMLPVDILVFREGDQLRIVLSNIYFEPFTANYLNVPAEEARQNMATLDRLAEVLKRYPAYKIHAEGHAVRVYWNDPVRGPVEEKEVLLPLSLGRAVAIRDALVLRGVRAERITVAGYGGTHPVVPHSDLDNRWKNRRVEFILVK